MRPVAGLVGALVVALALAGCGTSSLSADQLRNFATRACDLSRQRTDEIPTPSTPTEGASFLSRGIAALAPEQTTLESLHPPGNLATDYHAAVQASAQELTALRTTLAGLKAGDDPVVAVEGLQHRLAPLEQRADSAWRSLDLPACADR